MKNFHSLKFIKYSLVILIFYNILSLLVLFIPINSLKLGFWQITPYEHRQIMNFPNNFKNLSLLNSSNRKLINNFAIKNTNRNALDIDFWNYKLIIDSYSKDTNSDFEESFINLFFLTKNYKNKNLELKRYFIKNYFLFSNNTKIKILNNL